MDDFCSLGAYNLGDLQKFVSISVFLELPSDTQVKIAESVINL